MTLLLNGVDRLAGSGFLSKPLKSRYSVKPLRFGIVGCGFVADFYARSLHRHGDIELIGVFDRDSSRAEKFAIHHGVRCHASLQSLLEDPQLELVLNLTNPCSHYEVSKICLESGKHVYSEKPLAMKLAEADELVALAERQNLVLSAAPCSVLGGTARALADILNKNEIGRVRLVYAELDDGPIYQMDPESWASPAGTPWPWQDEFTVGCTLEHAGYYLSWLVALFGQAESVTAFTTCLVPDKHPDLKGRSGPDFSVGCIRFRSGVVARLTCGIVAPHDHSLRIIGDDGVLHVDECWHTEAPIRIRPRSVIGLRADTYAWMARSWLLRAFFSLDGKRHALSPKAGWRLRLRRHEMDYLLGVAEVAAALREARPPRLSARFALHVTELALALHEARGKASSVPIRSELPPMETRISPRGAEPARAGSA